MVQGLLVRPGLHDLDVLSAFGVKAISVTGPDPFPSATGAPRSFRSLATNTLYPRGKSLADGVVSSVILLTTYWHAHIQRETHVGLLRGTAGPPRIHFPVDGGFGIAFVGRGGWLCSRWP